MPRQTKAEIRAEAERAQRRQQRLERLAQQGTPDLELSARNAERVLRELNRRPEAHERHHAKEHPGENPERRCGWCGNLRTWGAAAAEYRAALPLAAQIEREVMALAVAGPELAPGEQPRRRRRVGLTQAELWEIVHRRWGHVRRDRVRELWARAHRELAAAEVAVAAANGGAQ